MSETKTWWEILEEMSIEIELNTDNWELWEVDD